MVPAFGEAPVGCGRSDTWSHEANGLRCGGLYLGSDHSVVCDDGFMDVVVSDIAFGESTRWHDGRIWFCDWADGDVRSTDPAGTAVSTHAHVDGSSRLHRLG